jgi:NAD(P)-dependent dehydrogenase (short-subunit alcohol dehydrogenase family)
MESLAPSELPMTALRQTYDTNFFGAVAVTNVMLPLLRRAPAARIVNVSSGLGSFALTIDEAWEQRSINALGYKSSKAALNMATLLFAYELRDTPIKVNASNPGATATDLSGMDPAELAARGFQTPEQGAASTVWLATLPADGPTGGFFGNDGTTPW